MTERERRALLAAVGRHLLAGSCSENARNAYERTADDTQLVAS